MALPTLFLATILRQCTYKVPVCVSPPPSHTHPMKILRIPMLHIRHKPIYMAEHSFLKFRIRRLLNLDPFSVTFSVFPRFPNSAIRALHLSFWARQQQQSVTVCQRQNCNCDTRQLPSMAPHARERHAPVYKTPPPPPIPPPLHVFIIYIFPPRGTLFLSFRYFYISCTLRSAVTCLGNIFFSVVFFICFLQYGK